MRDDTANKIIKAIELRIEELIKEDDEGCFDRCDELKEVIFYIKEQFSESDIESYKSALQKIANPMQYLQSEADKTGASLNGYAVMLSNDHNWLKEIARKALGY